MQFRPSSPEGRAVLEGMNNVHIPVVGRSSFTYSDFYKGFGLFATAYLVFAAFLAWYLGAIAKANTRVIRPVGWAFFALQLTSVALSWIYFAAPPAVLSGMVAICTGWAAWRL